MTLTLEDYRKMNFEQLQEQLKLEEESKTYWLESMNSYEDKEFGYYDSYNYNRCRNEAIKIKTKIKRIKKVLEERK